MRAPLSLLMLLTPVPALAQGFVSKNLKPIEAAATAALGPDAIGRTSDDGLLLTCPTCAGEPIVSIRIGRQDDGTEGRVRSGATTIATLEKQCQARAPECTLSALAVAPAVGWVSSYGTGSLVGSTAVILRDGDMLMVRALAADAATARGSVDRLLPLLRERVVGE